MPVGDGLKEQLEGVRANLAATQKKAAADLDALRAELQEARELASAEASKCGMLPEARPSPSVSGQTLFSAAEGGTSR